MKVVPFFFLLCLLPFVSSCKNASTTVDLEQEQFSFLGDDLLYGEWGNKSRVTPDLRCRGTLKEDRVLCDMVNVSDHDLILNRGVNGFSYAVKYQTKTGEVTFREYPNLVEWHFEHIEILSPLKLPELSIASGASTSFVIKLPSDCAKLFGIVIRVEYTTYAEMGQCKNACELRNLFGRNTRYVSVEFP